MGINTVKRRISDSNGRKYKEIGRYYISPNRVRYEYKGSLQKISDGRSNRGILYRTVYHRKRLELQTTKGGGYLAYVNGHSIKNKGEPVTYSGIDQAALAAENMAKK
jgi:hypothetical protein